MRKAPFVAASCLLVGAAEAQEISVRSAFGAPPAAERKLAELAEPSRRMTPAGEDPVAAARTLCGRVSSTYLDLLRSANPDTPLAPAPVARELVFPACFVLTPNATAVRLPFESLTTFANRVVGTSGPKTLAAIKQLNAGARVGPSLSAPAALSMPFVGGTTVYKLAPGGGMTPGEAAAELQKAVGVTAPEGAVAEVESSELIPAVTGGATLTVPTVCAAAGTTAYPDPAWPFDTAQFAAALKRNAAWRVSQGMPAARVVTLAVADNGVDGLGGAAFPDAEIAINGGETRADGLDNDGNDFIDDLVGVNLFSGLAPSPFVDWNDPQHGTHMAGLTLGGPAWRSSAAIERISPLVKIVAINMVERTVVGSTAGNQIKHAYPSEGLAKAMLYARRRGAEVVNFSVTTKKIITPFEDEARRADMTVIVVAAGNVAKNYDWAADLYPASYGGESSRLGGQVITVAAHDRSRCLESFSGRGGAAVDLAAPGRDIRSNSLNGAYESFHGTSQATALVAFVAANLKAEHVNSPRRVKERLTASVDLSPDLEPYVFAGGALNPVKAVSIHHDVLELDGGAEMRFGTLYHRFVLAELCPGLPDEANGQVLKISRTTGQGGALRVLLRPQTGVLKILRCNPVAPTFQFRPEGQTEFETIAFSSLQDLVPRF